MCFFGVRESGIFFLEGMTGLQVTNSRDCRAVAKSYALFRPTILQEGSLIKGTRQPYLPLGGLLASLGFTYVNS